VRTVFFDIDTQIDFLFPAGALYVPGAERLMRALSRLNHYAAAHGIPLVSTTCAHAEDDAEFRQWPPHCVVGTVGQQKPAELLLERRVVVPADPGSFAVEGAEQIILQKNQLDLTTNPHFPRLLEYLKADVYFVYGVVTEYCVRLAALALLQTGKPVSLITDAIQTLHPEDSRQTISECTGAGARLTTAEEVCAQ
jgi:nicotinamidase/pyrazinamidase